MEIYEEDDVEVFSSLTEAQMSKVRSFAHILCKNPKLKRVELDDEIQKLNPSPLEVHYLINYAMRLRNDFDPLEYIDLSPFTETEREMMKELKVKDVNKKARILLYRCLSGTLDYRKESIHVQNVIDKAKLELIKKFRKKAVKIKPKKEQKEIDKLKKDIELLSEKYEKLVEEKRKFGFKVENEVRRRLREKSTKNKKNKNSKTEK